MCYINDFGDITIANIRL